MKKLSVLMSALVVTLAFVACEKDDPTPTAKLTFKVGEEVVDSPIKVELGKTLDVTVSGGEEKYIAVSSDPKIIDVDVDGSVITITSIIEEPAPELKGDNETPEEIKTVTITVTDNNGVKGIFKVIVTEKVLSFDKDKLDITVGETAEVYVSDGTAPYTVSSADNDIATTSEVDEDGKITITAVSKGETEINIEDNKGVKRLITITVTEE